MQFAQEEYAHRSVEEDTPANPDVGRENPIVVDEFPELGLDRWTERTDDEPDLFLWDPVFCG
jgi:hypothetical protein